MTNERGPASRSDREYFRAAKGAAGAPERPRSWEDDRPSRAFVVGRSPPDSDAIAVARSLRLLEFHGERRWGGDRPCTLATRFAEPGAVGCA